MSTAHPWSERPESVAGSLKSDLTAGLTAEEAARRLEQYGPNQVEQSGGHGPWILFLRQFANLMIVLLGAAAVISALVGDLTDTVLIVLIVLANAIIGFLQEWKAERAVEALKKLSQPHARVWRDGRLEEISATDVVPGDLLEIKAGDLTPADARVILSAGLEADESPLTGESLPIEKTTDPIAADAPLPERSCMVYSGTAVVRGHGRAIVTGTGMKTELGSIATMLSDSETSATPLQRRLGAMNRWLALAIVGVSIVIFIAGVIRESNWTGELISRMLLTSVSIAVAAIPEGLPAVITVALALGSQRMARRQAIVRRLSAVETLGSVDVICSDKTGTLTQNRMEVSDVLALGNEPEGEVQLLQAGALCNDAEWSASGDVLGSATEGALVSAAADQGVDIPDLRKTHPRRDEIPFSSDRKRMATLHDLPEGGRRLLVKGAFDRVLPLCRASGEDVIADWMDRCRRLAEQGRRVLAIAGQNWDSDSLSENADESPDLQLLGIVGIVDPVRSEVRPAIDKCRSAGIRAVMITGDHQGTAESIAKELRILQPGEEVVAGAELDQMSDEELIDRAGRIAVYARVSPAHKLRIVKAHQARRSSVAMTGDGVNDAPALKQADIGVAMGITGADVSKEAAEMILADDNFTTIVAAVEEGRVVYDNIRKFVTYLLTANCGEVLVLLVAVLAGMPLPLLPIHILWINLVTDGLPALALGFESAERNIMQRRPRQRDESLFAGGLGRSIFLVGGLMALLCLVQFHFLLKEGAEGTQLDRARTMVFLTLSLSQLFYVLSVRSFSQSIFSMGLFSNWRLAAAVVVGGLLQFAVIFVPVIRPYFHAVALSATDVLNCLLVALVPFAVVELWKVISSRDSTPESFETTTRNSKKA